MNEHTENYWKNNYGGLQQQHVQTLEMISHKWKLKILDVGCGDGTFLECLPKEWKPKGLENSRVAFDKCKKGGFDVVQGDMNDLRGAGKYDLITILDVLEHTFTPEKVLKEIRKHADIVILTVPNMAFLKFRIQSLFGLVPDEFNAKKGHCQYMTKNRIEQIIKTAGFKIISENHYYMKGIPSFLPNIFATMFCYKINKVKK
jgi:2-polyprenyl-3-methyl-5-hydroxy-6-metoxy-1,4-benzoquinol methylase